MQIGRSVIGYSFLHIMRVSCGLWKKKRGVTYFLYPFTFHSFVVLVSRCPWFKGAQFKHEILFV
jgi:hypothetical protein